MKLLEQNVGTKVLDMGLSNHFFGCGIQSTIKKNFKNQQLGIHQPEKLLHVKETINK